MPWLGSLERASSHIPSLVIGATIVVASLLTSPGSEAAPVDPPALGGASGFIHPSRPVAPMAAPSSTWRGEDPSAECIAQPMKLPQAPKPTPDRAVAGDAAPPLS